MHPHERAQFPIGLRFGDHHPAVPLRLSFEQTLGGQQDSQWGHLSGMIRAGRESNGLLYLSTVTSGGTYLIILKEYPRDWASTLVDSKVSVDGVLAAIFNNHRQVTGTRIFVPSQGFIHIDEPAPVSAFDLPVSSAVSVGAFRIDQKATHRIRVRATVTAAVSEHLIYVSQGEGNLAIDLWVSCPSLKPGALLDIVGFPGTIEGRPGLESAVCRFVGMGKPVQPVDLSAATIMPPELSSDGSELSAAKASVNDLRLVRVAGTIIQSVTSPTSESLMMADGDRIFTTTVSGNVAIAREGFAPGTRLAVTGVCLIAFDDYQRAQSFRLLARDPADFKIISRASWLTVRRALWLIFPLIGITCGSFVWISVLRHHVRTKTVELRQANERLRQLAIEDALTGTANRRRFDEAVRSEVARFRNTGEPLSLIMVDLDYFKQVNDRYGHQRGDQSLIQVAGALRKSLLGVPKALVARYGGEEFAILLPRTETSKASLVAEELRESVYEMGIQHEGSPFERRQTISLGVASLCLSTDETDADGLVRLADRALYAAKERGRNCVVSSNPEKSGDVLVLDGVHALSAITGTR